MSIVEADQQRVLQRAGVEAGLCLVVGGPDRHFRLGDGPDAVDRAIVSPEHWRPAVHGLVADLALLPAQVLSQRPGIVQSPAHLRGQRLLLGIVFVETRLADEALAADLAIRRTEHATALREAGAGRA